GIVFAAMSAAQGVGDHHPGQWLPFWKNACTEGRRYACPYLANVLAGFCDRGSGWACSELGILEARDERDRADALESMARGCELGYAPACLDADRVATAGRWESAPPPAADYPIVLRGSKGPIRDLTP